MSTGAELAVVVPVAVGVAVAGRSLLALVANAWGSERLATASLRPAVRIGLIPTPGAIEFAEATRNRPATGIPTIGLVWLVLLLFGGFLVTIAVGAIWYGVTDRELQTGEPPPGVGVGLGISLAAWLILAAWSAIRRRGTHFDPVAAHALVLVLFLGGGSGLYAARTSIPSPIYDPVDQTLFWLAHTGPGTEFTAFLLVFGGLLVTGYCLYRLVFHQAPLLPVTRGYLASGAGGILFSLVAGFIIVSVAAVVMAFVMTLILCAALALYLAYALISA